MCRIGTYVAMQLQEYLAQHKISYRRFAQRLGERLGRPGMQHNTVLRYCLPPDHASRRDPDRATRLAIWELTAGAVAGDDWDAAYRPVDWPVRKNGGDPARAQASLERRRQAQIAAQARAKRRRAA